MDPDCRVFVQSGFVYIKSLANGAREIHRKSGQNR